MYCEDCMHIVDVSPCPLCGEDNVRQPRPEDVCFLIQVLPLWGSAVEDLLTRSGIPCLRKSNLGAGMVMKAGSFLEEIMFFIRREHLALAREAVSDLFPDAFDPEECG